MMSALLLLLVFFIIVFTNCKAKSRYISCTMSVHAEPGNPDFIKNIVQAWALILAVKSLIKLEVLTFCLTSLNSLYVLLMK